MTGLTVSGFVPETYEAIKARIEGKLETLNPGFDFSPESPDGQLIGIMTYELFQAWSQLALVYDSYNPQVATGAALRNIGLITGLPYGVATRSTATLETVGTTGTIIPSGSLVTDDDGNEFYTVFDTAIPSNLQVVAVVAGPINVDAGALTTIKTPVAGWTSFTQSTAGVLGTLAQTDQQYRNTRQQTVMRNFTGVADTIQARLVELGLGQTSVYNNDHPSVTAPDGTPPQTIHVTVGELGTVTAEEVALTILNAKPLGCPTFGNTATVVTDDQGFSHTINYSVATAVDVEVNLDVTYLDDNTAGADENIKNALFEHINSLPSGEDVVWSRLFGYVTPYAKAKINTLTVAYKAGSHGIADLVIDEDEFAAILLADISLSVT